MDWAVGVVNSYSDTMSDRDNEKGVLGGIKWHGETISVGANAFYGGDSADFGPWGTITGTDPTRASDARATRSAWPTWS